MADVADFLADPFAHGLCVSITIINNNCEHHGDT